LAIGDAMDIKEWLPEFSVSSEEDKDLMRYFVKTKQISEILNQNKWMVLGRKGTGKTAIFEYFNSKQFAASNRLTVPLNFKDYPWPIHRLYKESMEGELNAYYKSWNYIIVTQALSNLISLIEKTSSLPEDLKNCKKIINSIYGKPNPTIIDTIKSKIGSLVSLSLPELNAGELSASLGEISFEEISEDQKLKNRLKTNAFTLLDYFQKCLMDNVGVYEIYVTLDQLDENWLESEIDEYSKILINLINVCKSLNSKREMQHIRIILFLRTDIFETLKFNDKNKIFQSSSIEIHWDNESLDQMFYERIIKNKPDDLVLDSSLRSNSIFEVQYVRHGATPFKHILRRSFYRPRDIIVYFNKIRNVHIESKKGLFTSSDLYSAENDFSISIYNELMDEWSNQKPEIESYLNVLQNIGVQKFNYKKYDEYYLKKFPKADKSEIQESLSFLFQNSIVGQKTKANWEFVCVNPYLQIDFSKQFYVNNGLKSRLTIVEQRQAR